MNKAYVSELLIVLVVVAISVAVASGNYLSAKQAENKVAAVNNCAKVAASVPQNGDFNGNVYKFCVEDSGYTTGIK
ncbi:hypothetical protein A3D77_06480 [Candidatus Gottesmanbacteria bacterium RIFCSPHIGHO2_02_FULL_39_11]|uniref:Uncharacterized protein n=1 Tax=Candidatus Gottesmanbacteria bacterium RIFCSPHIGHO2_02_FULL_39_11 TaxID=1798382 RepID=A0A1F5ZTQ2_9BACT|nr:MAG: hypothetical protein A3D77_06480 [Candidatus Gottesmanbacteria bacterium RIFCSPHIGHO2_02_FULL_39_11]